MISQMSCCRLGSYVDLSTFSCLSNPVFKVRHNCWGGTLSIVVIKYSWNDIFEKRIIITATEVVVISCFLLPLFLNKKEKRKRGIPWHFHIIQKSALLITMESHLCLDWLMKCSIYFHVWVKSEIIDSVWWNNTSNA